jgi:hypothetical protein
MRAALLALATSERLAVWPLLVLDAGVFLARCRWCSWTSGCQSNLDTALAAYEAHLCEGRSR